jgi:hypothetical protein
MLDENVVKITELDAEISEEGFILIGKSKLKEIYNDGYKEVKLIVMGKPSDVLIPMNIDKSKFEKIKNMQNLPDAVVIDFLKSKGKALKENRK